MVRKEKLKSSPKVRPTESKAGPSRKLFVEVKVKNSPSGTKPGQGNKTSERFPSRMNSDELAFRKDYGLFIAGLKQVDPELEVEINFAPFICGSKTSLYRLWQTVTSQEYGGFDNINEHDLWHSVADSLDINSIKHRDAARQLCECYEISLLHEFEDVNKLKRGINNQLSETQEIDLLGDQSWHVVDLIDSESDEETRASLLTGAAVQRGLKHDLSARKSTATHSSDHSRNHKKARHDDRISEIPPTPENKSNMEVSIHSHHNGEPHTPKQILATPPPRAASHNSPSGRSRSGRGKLRTPIKRIHELDANDQDSQQSEDEAVVHWVDHYEKQGIPPHITVAAMACTTMEITHLSQVIRNLHEGKGIPRGIEGVWTGKDDEALYDEASEEHHRIKNKHGQARLLERRNFLQRLGE